MADSNEKHPIQTHPNIFHTPTSSMRGAFKGAISRSSADSRLQQSPHTSVHQSESGHPSEKDQTRTQPGHGCHPVPPVQTRTRTQHTISSPRPLQTLLRRQRPRSARPRDPEHSLPRDRERPCTLPHQEPTGKPERTLSIRPNLSELNKLAHGKTIQNWIRTT